LQEATAGDPASSARFDEILRPLGLAHELRACFSSEGRTWGVAALLRGKGERPFGDDDVRTVANLGETIAEGLRASILVEVAGRVPPAEGIGPAVIVLDARDEIEVVTPVATARLEDFPRGQNEVLPSAILAAAAAARAAGSSGARLRTRGRSGAWWVVSTTTIDAGVAKRAKVVATIEEARTADVVPLVVAALGLSARERDVLIGVLEGQTSLEVADALGISSHTANDHLKSIFVKADVRSRRELVARIFFEHYAPRIGTPLGPSGGSRNSVKRYATRTRIGRTSAELCGRVRSSSYLINMAGKLRWLVIGCALLACSGPTSLHWSPPPGGKASEPSEPEPEQPVETAGRAGTPAVTGGGAGLPAVGGSSGGAPVAGTGGTLENGGVSGAGTAGSTTDPSSQAGAGGNDEMPPEFPAHDACGTTSEYSKRYCSDLDSLSIELKAIEDEGGDGSVSPGESARLVFTLTNDSREMFPVSPCVGVVAAAPGLTVLESYNPAPHLYGLMAGQSAQVKTRIRIESSVEPGTRIPIQAWLDVQGARCPTTPDVEFELRVGP